jgi:hypothetical protein
MIETFAQVVGKALWNRVVFIPTKAPKNLIYNEIQVFIVHLPVEEVIDVCLNLDELEEEENPAQEIVGSVDLRPWRASKQITTIGVSEHSSPREDDWSDVSSQGQMRSLRDSRPEEEDYWRLDWCLSRHLITPQARRELERRPP